MSDWTVRNARKELTGHAGPAKLRATNNDPHVNELHRELGKFSRAYVKKVEAFLARNPDLDVMAVGSLRSAIHGAVSILNHLQEKVR